MAPSAATSDTPRPVSARNKERVAKNKEYKNRYDELQRRIVGIEEELEYVSGPDERSLMTRLKRLTRKRDAIKDRFIEENLPLAYEQARMFKSTGYDGNNQDYKAAAIVGMWDAFLRWDPEASTFATFSRMWISGRIRKEVCSVEFPGMSYPDFKARPAVMDSIARLSNDGRDRDPTAEEVAADTGLTIGVVERVIGQKQKPVQLDQMRRSKDAKGSHDPGVSLKDELVMEDSAQPPPAELRDVLSYEDLRRILSPIEIWVFSRRYGIDGGHTHHLQMIAATTGLSKTAVSEVLKEAKAKVEQVYPGLKDIDW